MLVFANILQPLIDVAKSVLEFFHDEAGLSWGWSIVALTVVVRAALIPLTLKQFKSMQDLQRLQPEMKKLQAKYKDDKQRLNQEMMKFYQEHKVNPLGSCLPLLFQLPVFVALFYMLQDDLKRDICGTAITSHIREHGGKIRDVACDKVDPGSAQFLFIPDLTSKATGAVLVTLVLMYVVSQLASSLLMTVTADRNQRLLFMALPIFFVIFIINFPAGLLVYWITTNLWTIVQQFIVKKTVGPIKPPEIAPATGGGGGGGGGSGGGGPPGGGSPDGRSPKGPKGPKGGKAAGDPELAGVGARSGKKPPPPPRKKKKRSGRRR